MSRDRLRQVQTDLALDDVKGRREFDIVDVIPAQVDVHQPRHTIALLGILIELHTLHQGRGAVANTDNGYPDFLALLCHSRPPRKTCSGCISLNMGTSVSYQALGKRQESLKEWDADFRR